MSEHQFLAFDLGAESGRAMLGTVAPDGLDLVELHRFPNEPVRLPTGLYWDTLRLHLEIQRGLQVAGRERRLTLSGIAIDTWGVDFGILSADRALVDNPRHYRDTRNQGVMDQAFAVVPKERIYAATGVQFMPFNTLYQWYALRLARSTALECGRTMLLMPDLFNCWLTGVERAEMTIASTTQFYDPSTRDWASSLLRDLGLDPRMLPPLVPPGEPIGTLLPAVAEQAGLSPRTIVYATASHDTAAAVAAVPAEGDDWCYISSGTWSLMGVELAEPVLTARSLELNFTNEVGVDHSIRLLKNIAGLWVLQECRRAWAAEGHHFQYSELTRLASEAQPQGGFLPIDEFLDPGNMPARICEYCRKMSKPVPESTGEVCRLVLESLATRYAEVLRSLEELSGKRLNRIHIIGGGSQNRLLNQLVADATGRTVIAGPAEATAIGNIVVQAIGAGVLPNLATARDLIRRMCGVDVFEPAPI